MAVSPYSVISFVRQPVSSVRHTLCGFYIFPDKPLMGFIPNLVENIHHGTPCVYLINFWSRSTEFQSLVNIGPGNGLLPECTKPLTEPILIHHSPDDNFSWYEFENYYLDTTSVSGDSHFQSLLFLLHLTWPIYEKVKIFHSAMWSETYLAPQNKPHTP